MPIDLTFVAEFIGNVGFPIFIAIYFVYHQDRRLREIDTKLDRMNTLIALVLVKQHPEAFAAYERVFAEKEEKEVGDKTEGQK